MTLFLRNFGSSADDKVGTGTALRFVGVAIDDVLGGEGVPSQRPYLTPQHDLSQQHGPLHVNPYPNTAAPGQTPRECAAGNEPFSASRASIGNPPGNLGVSTETTKRRGS